MPCRSNIIPNSPLSALGAADLDNQSEFFEFRIGHRHTAIGYAKRYRNTPLEQCSIRNKRFPHSTTSKFEILADIWYQCIKINNCTDFCKFCTDFWTLCTDLWQISDSLEPKTAVRAVLDGSSLSRKCHRPTPARIDFMSRNVYLRRANGRNLTTSSSNSVVLLLIQANNRIRKHHFDKSLKLLSRSTVHILRCRITTWRWHWTPQTPLV